jgi:exosortase/archaeosortase
VHSAHGTISGGPVVIGDLVFYSNLTKRQTQALGVATGKVVWTFGDGAFNPVISDGKRLYLNGYSTLFMLTTPRQARLDRAALAKAGAR